MTNPWRAENTVEIAGEKLTLRCTWAVLAALLADFGIETFYDLHKKWDGLHPETMRRSLEHFALDKKRAGELFDAVQGQAGIVELHGAFYEIVSGRTPDEIAAEAQAKKKLARLPAEIARAVAEGLASNPALAAMMGE